MGDWEYNPSSPFFLIQVNNMSNIIDSIQLSGVTYTIQGSGGGKAIEAGRGISVTTGETADTVSFNLPISAGTGTNSINFGGSGVKASGQGSFAGGSYSEAKKTFSMAFGRCCITNNYGEVALGFFNKSNGSSSAAENSSGNTLFSVGNGTNNYGGQHNAFEIRQNGDIYLSSGGTDIKLQDHLGGGGGGSSYTAGDGIDITNDVISVSGVVMSSAITTSITSSSTDAQVPSAKAVNDKLGGLSLVKLTQSEYDALATKDNSTLYVIVN